MMIGLCILLSALAATPDPSLLPAQMGADLDLLEEGLITWHGGLFWHTTPVAFDATMAAARASSSEPLTRHQFYGVVARVMAQTREAHAVARPPTTMLAGSGAERLFPGLLGWAGEELVLVWDGRPLDASDRRGSRVLSINGRTPAQLSEALFPLLPRDGFAEVGAIRDSLGGLLFSLLHVVVFGPTDHYEVVLDDGQGPVTLQFTGRTLKELRPDLIARYPSSFGPSKPTPKTLHLQQVAPGIAFLAVDTFNNDAFNGNYKRFLRRAFDTIADESVHTLILDLSQNGGGNEGNENLLFSYLGENYQKYDAVRVNQAKAVIGAQTTTPIRHRVPWLDRLFTYKRMPDGRLERRDEGLSAFRGPRPKHAFSGTLFVAVGPSTYSGGSELANMLYTRQRGRFVGEPTSGGFWGNTSGTSFELELPASGIAVKIPMIRFEMNVQGLPAGSALIPHEYVVPTVEQLIRGERAAALFILDALGAEAELPPVP